MGFADELRKTPDKKVEQKNKDWSDFERLFIDYIKGYCRYVAGDGRCEGSVYLRDFIDNLEDNYTSQERENYVIYDIEFESSTESRLWERMRNEFFFFVCDDPIKRRGHYPAFFGMTKKNAEEFSAAIKKVLDKEGLNVKIFLKKENQKVIYEDKYIEHSSFEKLVTGKEGHYVERAKEGEWMYSFDIDLSW